MNPDFETIDKLADKFRQANLAQLRAENEFRTQLEANGYRLHTFGNYETHNEILIHSSVNPHQIYENGEIHEDLDPRLSWTWALD